MHRRTPRDLQTEAYYIESSREVPVDLALMAGDALQNLRSALDHLIYQAIFKQTNVWPTKRTIAFPMGRIPMSLVKGGVKRGHCGGVKVGQ
jgi:hypothetical protein